jgi:nondiscriminating aspartyl-tRNA synthetase
MKRTYIKDLSSGEVLINGWVHSLRGQSKIKFLQIRDITGIVQCIVLDDKLFDEFSKLTPESVVEIKGNIKSAVVKSEEVTITDKELEATSLKLINVAKPLPFPILKKDEKITTELSKRLDFRFVDLHKSEIQAIFKIQSTILKAFRDFMDSEGAIECIFPSIIGASSEGGTEVFPVQYFEKKALLSQSCQLYKQMLTCSLEKVYTVFPVWRAEKHNTLRHLNESRQFDFEMAFADDKMVMEILGRCVQYIVKKVLENNADDLKQLNVEVKVPHIKYLTFKEAIEEVKKHGINSEENDLNGEAEEKLGEIYPDTVVFVHDWPIAGKPFYIMPKGEDLSYGFDAIYNGMEITSGGQRIHLPDLLIERLKIKGLNPDNFESYIDSFRYGAPHHAGWGMGVERLTMKILNIKNIREVTLFPRDRDRLTP